jgi:hypothetical protein
VKNDEEMKLSDEETKINQVSNLYVVISESEDDEEDYEALGDEEFIDTQKSGRLLTQSHCKPESQYLQRKMIGGEEPDSEDMERYYSGLKPQLMVEEF